MSTVPGLRTVRYKSTYTPDDSNENGEHVALFLKTINLYIYPGIHVNNVLTSDFFYFYFFIYLQTDQGIQNLSSADAQRLSADDPDYAIRDLYNHIEDGKYPSWTLKIQVMTPEQAEKYKWNPFDVTKVSCKKTKNENVTSIFLVL